MRNSYLPNPKIKLVLFWTSPLASLNMVAAGRPKNLSGLNSSGSSNSSVLECKARMLPTIVVPFSMMLPRQLTKSKSHVSKMRDHMAKICYLLSRSAA